MAFLTTAAPTWNNLLRTFRGAGAMLELTAYLSAARQKDAGRLVGSPLSVEFDRAKYTPEVRFITPLGGSAGIFPVFFPPPARRRR